MAIEPKDRTSRPSRWSSIFTKNKTVRREEGVSGAGDLETRDPIQHVAGTGFVVNQAQDPLPEKQQQRQEEQKSSSNDVQQQQDGATGDAAVEGARASQPASIRRGSDADEISADKAQSSGGGGVNGAGEGVDGAGKEEQDDDDVASASRIEFYRKDQEYFWLSNSSEHPVYFDGVRYATAEHLFQSLKFLPHRPDIATKVRKVSSPQDAIKEARKNMTEVKKGWIGGSGNVAAMRVVLLLKFTQHSLLQKHLLLTGDAELVEASPTDAFWGNAAPSEGSFGGGRNELGKALVRTRETIRQQAGLGIGSGAKTV